MRYYLIINIHLQNRNLNLETFKNFFFFHFVDSFTEAILDICFYHSSKNVLHVFRNKINQANVLQTKLCVKLKKKLSEFRWE